MFNTGIPNQFQLLLILITSFRNVAYILILSSHLLNGIESGYDTNNFRHRQAYSKLVPFLFHATHLSIKSKISWFYCPTKSGRIEWIENYLIT